MTNEDKYTEMFVTSKHGYNKIPVPNIYIDDVQNNNGEVTKEMLKKFNQYQKDFPVTITIDIDNKSKEHIVKDRLKRINKD